MSVSGNGIMDSKFFPVVFMLILTVIFVGILAAFYRASEKGIEQYKQQTYKLQILSLFADTLSVLTGIEKAELTDPVRVQENYEKYIREVNISSDQIKTVSSRYFTASIMQDNVLGYCFDIKGSGLWGTMRGLMAVTPDFSKIINFVIYDQMETPGLGSRVTEDWFKQQFAGKSLISGNAVEDFSLVQEDATANAAEIRQVTGATITSSAVLKIIVSAAAELRDLRPDLKGEQDE